VSRPGHSNAAGRASRPAASCFAAALGLAVVFAPAVAGVPAGVPIARLATPARVIALSFDDGPQATPALDSLLAILAARDVHATFFVIGEELALHPETGRRLLAAGHELGNHTWTHPRLDSIPVDSMRVQIARTDRLLRAIGVRGRILFRPPYGVLSDADVRELERRHRIVTLFDVDPGDDFPGAPADSVVERTLMWLGPGSILVLHPWYENSDTVGVMLPRILDRLLGMGYRVTTVSNLLQTKRARIEPSLYHETEH